MSFECTDDDDGDRRMVQEVGCCANKMWWGWAAEVVLKLGGWGQPMGCRLHWRGKWRLI